MELRQLRYFIAVCTAGSMARASKALHIAQPALSRQMAALEEEFGARLLVRLPRGIAPTRAGEVLLDHARLVLGNTDSLCAQVGLAAQGKAGALRIGVPPACSWLPALGSAIATLSRELPNTEVFVKSGLSSWQIEAIKQHELDAGIVAWRSPFDGTVTGMKIYEDHMALAMPASVARRIGEVRELSDLAGEEFILFPRESSPSHYDALVRTLKSAGIPIGRPRLVGFDFPTVVGLVSAGLGCAVVPSSYKHQGPTDIVIKDIHDLDLKFSFELVWRTESNDPLLDAFIRLFSLSKCSG